jgi:hypothetical protein
MFLLREPGKFCGAIGFALIFLLLFASRQKVKGKQQKTSEVADRRVLFFSLIAIRYEAIQTHSGHHGRIVG